MSINDLLEKSNPVVDFGTAPSEQTPVSAKIHYRVKPFYTLLLFLVIASIFFALGRISALDEMRSPIKIEYPDSSQAASVVRSSLEEGVTVEESGVVIGSKNGTKYYFPWCGTVKMIKPENQVRFSSIEEARSAGYLPASNCKGLK